MSIEAQDSPEGRIIVATYANGDVTRTVIDLEQKPRRNPRKPIARATFKLAKRES